MKGVGIFIGISILVWAAHLAYQHNPENWYGKSLKPTGYAALVEKYTLVAPTQAYVKGYEPKPTANPTYAERNKFIDYILGCEINCP